MGLLIEDEAVTALVARLAERRGVSDQDAVRLAVEAELGRADGPLIDRLERFWTENPMPRSTGLTADKAFFDELSTGG